MGAVGFFTEALLAPIDQPWAETFNFWVGTTKTTPASLTSAQGYLKQQDQSDAVAFSLTQANGRLNVSGGAVNITVATADLGTLQAGQTYDFELIATDASGAARQVRGPVKILASLGS